LIGFYYHWKIDPKMAFIMTIYFVLTGFALAVYFNMQQEQPRERDYFFVYSFFGFCLWIGMGTLAIVNYLEQILKEQQARIAGYCALALAFIFVPANMLRSNIHPSSRYGHYLAWDYAYNLLQSTEKDAILITNGDNDTFPLWYLQDVEGVRRDVRVICLSLANTDWYIKQLKDTEPFGAKKVPISMTDDQITGIQPVQYEPQMFSLPVPRSAKEEWDTMSTPPANSDVALQHSLGSEIVDTVKFVMPATLQFGNIKALRVQDILVFDIVRTNRWERPIYFATTGGDDSKIGLQDHMEMRGLAMKLVPRKVRNFWEGVNENVLRKQLMTDVQTPLQTPSFGFRWRGLQDPAVHFDENQRRLIMNYRQAFLSLTVYLTNVKHDSAGAIAALNRMEQVIPHALLSIDYRSKADIAEIYRINGDTLHARQFAAELVTELNPYLTNAQMTEQLDQYNPLIVLSQSYESLKEYDKAIATMNHVAEVYSRIPGIRNMVDQRIREIKAIQAK